jgi:ABC-2 type transport system permease protein/sodium transport system permease protein
LSTPTAADAQPDYPSSRWLRLILKELRETLRDRRTILTLLAMPVLAYPLLGVSFQRLLLAQTTAAGQPEYLVAMPDQDQATVFNNLLKEGRDLYDARERIRRGEEENGSQKATPTKPPGSRLPMPAPTREPIISSLAPPAGSEPSNVEAQVSLGYADVGVMIEEVPSFDQGKQHSGRLRFFYAENSPLSETAYHYLVERIEAVNAAYLHTLAREVRRSPSVMDVAVTVLPSSERSNTMLAGLIPLVLLLMTVTGAVYPSIDLTAGERERHTLETLIAAPVSRLELLLAKYVAVVAVALLTAVVNLTAMYFTMQAVGFEQMIFGDSGLTFKMALSLFGLLAVFAAFFSAVLLCVTSVARSFKEAQAYLIPLMMMSIAPGMAGLLPGVEPGPWFAAIPLLNIVLLAKALLIGTATAALTVISVGSTLLYGLLALSLAARWFGSDAVMSGSSERWIDLFRRPMATARRLTLENAAAAFAVILPVFFVAGSLIGRWESLSIEDRLAWNAGLTALLFGIWPGFVAQWRKVPLPVAFRVVQPRWPAVLGAILAGASAWPFVYEVAVLQEKLGIQALNVGQKERVDEILRQWNSVPFPMILLSLAIVPAIFEELTFRGFLFSALRSRFKPWATILITAIAFGALHTLVMGTLAIERFLTTALLGVVLGWIAYRSESVLPGMLFHITNNSIQLAIARYKSELQTYGWDLANERHIPRDRLMTAGMVLAIGLILVRLANRHDMHAADRDEPVVP